MTAEGRSLSPEPTSSDERVPSGNCPFHDQGLPLSLPPEVTCTCDHQPTISCNVCGCFTEDGNVSDCTDCGAVGCEDCIQNWDDVIGDLCPTCRRSYA